MIGIMAAILSAMHMQRADDLFGMPNGTPITDRLIEASIQWAERIMDRIDSLHVLAQPEMEKRRSPLV